MNKPPAGYSRNADGTLSPIPGGPADPSIASGRLTANQRVDLENKRGTLRNLASGRSEEHTSELQSLMRISYAVFCLKKKNQHKHTVHKHVYRNLNIRSHNKIRN